MSSKENMGSDGKTCVLRRIGRTLEIEKKNTKIMREASTEQSSAVLPSKQKKVGNRWDKDL